MQFIFILLFGLVLGFGFGFYSGIVVVDTEMKKENIVCYEDIMEDEEFLHWLSKEFNIYNLT